MCQFACILYTFLHKVRNIVIMIIYAHPACCHSQVDVLGLMEEALHVELHSVHDSAHIMHNN